MSERARVKAEEEARYLTERVGALGGLDGKEKVVYPKPRTANPAGSA